MKKILFCLLFMLQTLLCFGENLHRFVLPDGTDVIIYENSVSPAVMVGFVFDFGQIDVPAEKCGIERFIFANIIGDKTHLELQNAGISCSKRIDKEYSEIVAILQPKDLKDFFRLMRRNLANFSVRNFEYIKQKILLHEKLNFCSHKNEDVDLVFSSVDIVGKNTCSMFNRDAFERISAKDVTEFYTDVFAKSHMSIIICGAIDKRTAKNIITSAMGNLPAKNKMDKNICEKHLFKNIYAENKFLSPSLHFGYKISKNIDEKIKEMSVRVFSYEMFRFLAVAYSDVLACGVQDLILKGDNVFDVCLIPKSDVSLNQLENIYSVFTRHLQHKHFTEEEICSLIPMIKNSYTFTLNDLSEMYQYLKKQILSSNDVNSILSNDAELKKVSVKQIEEFFKDKLFSNPLYKVRTQYGANP